MSKELDKLREDLHALITQERRAIVYVLIQAIDENGQTVGKLASVYNHRHAVTLVDNDDVRQHVEEARTEMSGGTPVRRGQN